MTRAHESGPAQAEHESQIREAMAAGKAVNDAYQQEAGSRFGPRPPGGAQGSGPGDVVAGEPGSPSGAEADRLYRGKR